jgi:hypothetical protein
VVETPALRQTPSAAVVPADEMPWLLATRRAVRA